MDDHDAQLEHASDDRLLPGCQRRRGGANHHWQSLLH
jgi:hypothetical protein